MRISQKEYEVCSALIDEEMGCLRSFCFMESKVMTNYYITLANLKEKLREASNSVSKAPVEETEYAIFG